MNNYKSSKLNDEDRQSQSSDEKMDTGSESFKSQDSNSILSDLDDPNEVLRLQNPEEDEKVNDNLKTRPKNLGIGPPKLSSTLTLTTSHPLMGVSSPDYPDVIPKRLHKIEDEKDISLSSIEDEKFVETNGYLSPIYPQRNTSKNNLYFYENFVTAESLLVDSLDNRPPDVARVQDRRPVKQSTPRINIKNSAIDKSSQSTPKTSFRDTLDLSEQEEFHTVAEWCESPSQLRSLPNFELPIEMSSSIAVNNELESPDVVSSSTQEDKSAYQALLDPYTGSVALRHTVSRSPASTQRRKIQVPIEEDRCSLDSVSVCSMESEDEPPQLDQIEERTEIPSDNDDTKRSKSTNTVSECSEPIPEYSAAEELQDERSWVSVQRGNGHATCDMKVIEPYKRVVSHGGYDGGGAALIVFSACHLPDGARQDYRYVMDNLFLYVIWTLERLVTDEYVLVYLHGSAGRRKLPTFHWLHECYKLIDRRLRKSLKHLYLVHPTFWLKSFVILTKPFVSSKFFRKLSYVRSLSELMERVPVEPNAIPELVKQYDATRR